MGQSELIELEEQGWRALSSTVEAAAEFYEWVLDDTVVMLLPGGMGWMTEQQSCNQCPGSLGPLSSLMTCGCFSRRRTLRL